LTASKHLGHLFLCKRSFFLLPISPERLEEKIKSEDPFFEAVLREGIVISEED
jgi:hypothetical protein